MLAASTETLRVTEIFHSIQGESTWAGLPCVFVRLARCNLRCRWCDTAYSFRGGATWSIADIVRRVGEFGTNLVEVTGGEPLAQANCAPLCQALLDKGRRVLVETGGSLPIHGLPREAVRIMDVKCPDSGESERNHWPNMDALDAGRDEVKFVIASRGDYEWSRSVLTRYTLPQRCKAVLFSPVFSELEPVSLAGWILEDRLPVRMQLQMHKYIWPPDARGV